MADIEEPIGMEEAARFLGVKKATLYVWISDKKIKTHKTGKKNAFFKSELAAYVRAR